MISEFEDISLKANISYAVGDATEPQGKGNKVIAHIVNDLGLWGSGFVMAVSGRWPNVKHTYVDWARGNKQPFQLGQVQFVPATKDITIANMVAQRGIVNSENPKPLQEYWLKWALIRLNDYAIENSATVHMPRIGCGLAGGKWEEVEPLIKTYLQVDVTVYDLEVK